MNSNSGLIQAISTVVLVVITAFYALQTKRTVQEIRRQTKIQQMPVIMLFVRDIRDYMDNAADYDQQQKYRRKFEDFLIRIRTEGESSNYYLGVRNVGNGAAFNIEIKSEVFEVSKYQSRFLAPHKDEQPFEVIERSNKKIENWNKFKDSIFEIFCSDVVGNQHVFKYKILELEKKRIDFVRHEQFGSA